MLGSIEGATMPSADDIWEWIRTPLEELKNDLGAEPDKPWETRRAEFLEHLGLSEPSQYPVIEHLLEHLDQLAEDDRANLISSGEIDSLAYQLAQQYDVGDGHQDAGHAEPAAAETSGYDEQAWHAYLAENGPYWNGTEEAWDQFREWFIYHATERGLGEPATSLLDHLTAQPAAERITTFAQYGVTITPKASEPEPDGLSHEDIETAMAEVLAENPELADIPEERRREILAEVLGQVQS